MACRGFESVCTNDEARAYFENKGLSYSDITDGSIKVLCEYLRDEFRNSNKAGETSSKMTLSRKVEINRDDNGKLVNAFLFVNSEYFKYRECISFNRDGFIGIAGWADIGNLNPIKRAFIKWCDYLK